MRNVPARFRLMLLGLITATLLLGTAREARADYEFALSIGYAHVSLDGSAAPFDDRDGVRVEPRFTFGVSDEIPQLRLAAAIGFSGYSRTRDDDGDDFVVIDDEVFFIDTDDEESLSLITPEFQVSWRQPLDADKRWFIEPGVAVGVVIANYWVGDRWGWYYDEDVDEWDATIAGRPFLRAGYQADHWLIGLEASYLFGGQLDFTDDINGDVEEFYAGVFFGGRW